MDDSELRDLDPYALFDREADRIATHLRDLPAKEWERASRCEGWSVRDVLAHLMATEEYHQACLGGTVKELMARMGERGATDLTSANEMGIRDQDDKSNDELLAEWVESNAGTRAGFRDREDGTVDSSIGDYPARWQTFHLATELAVHADDMYVPVSSDEAAYRTAWRAAFSRFALQEAKPDVAVETVGPGRTRVSKDDLSVEVDDEELVEGVASRLDDSSRLSKEERDLLSATP